jgi:hypothetical protein
MNTKITKKHVFIFLSLIIIVTYLKFHIDCNQRISFHPATEIPRDIYGGTYGVNSHVIGSSIEKKSEYYNLTKGNGREFKTLSDARNYCIQSKFGF